MRTRIRRASITQRIHEKKWEKEQELLENINNKLGAIVILLTRLEEKI